MCNVETQTGTSHFHLLRQVFFLFLNKNTTPCMISSDVTSCNLSVVFHKSDFLYYLASTRPVTALCVLFCCIVCVYDCVMVIHKPNAQRMQHTHMHKAVTGRIETKKLLSRRRQSDYSSIARYTLCFVDLCLHLSFARASSKVPLKECLSN